MSFEKTNHGITRAEVYKSEIDGLRGLAIFAVICHHVLHDSKVDFRFDYLAKIIDNGYFGVQLFFIISAFTILRSQSLNFKNGDYSALKFYIGRFFRIIPLWWLNVFLCAFLFNSSWTVILQNLFFIFGFFPDPRLKIVDGSWSLFVEEIFYLFFPLFFKYLHKIKYVIFGLILSITIRFSWIFIGEKYNLDRESEFFWGSPLYTFTWFIIGFLIFHIHENKYQFNIFKKRQQTWDLILLVFCFILPILDQELYIFLLLPLVFIRGIDKKSLMRFLVNLPLFKYMGRFSFSMYLTHFYVLTWLDKKNIIMQIIEKKVGISGEMAFLLHLTIATTITFIISYITFTLVEKPSVRMGNILKIKLRKPASSNQP